jgi:hypothetical protein
VILPVTRTKYLLPVVLLLGLAPRVAAQRVSVGDPLEDYARVVSLLDSAPHVSFSIRPLSDTAWGTVLWDPFHLWGPMVDDTTPGSLNFTPWSIRTTANTAYPSGQNDGILWGGKGINTIVGIGATWRRGHFEATLAPEFTFSSNAEFPLAPVTDTGRSDYAYPWHRFANGGQGIDAPQRMGPDAFSTFSWGKSSVRLRSGGWALGVSTEEQWWGPALRNPLLMSNTARGFAHASLGTLRPVEIPWFKLETNWIWGQLRNSGWSDSIPTDQTRYVTGLIMSLQPNIVPGVSFGGSRLFYMNTPPGGIEASDLFLVFQGLTKASQASDSNPGGDDLRDQYISVFLRVAPPASGFEAYLEFGRNDHSWDMRDFWLEPGHSTASTIGMQKVFPLVDGRIFRLAAEWTDLEKDLTQLVRATPTWYVHHIVRDGWTQEGQYLGAGIGPGSISFAMWGDMFAKWGRAGLLLQRVAYDNDALYHDYAGDPYDRERHQVEFTAQASGMVFWRGLEIEGALGWQNYLNRNFEPYNDVSNWHFELGVRSRNLRWP